MTVDKGSVTEARTKDESQWHTFWVRALGNASWLSGLRFGVEGSFLRVLVLVCVSVYVGVPIKFGDVWGFWYKTA